MATKAINGKSATLAARVPLELAERIASLLADGESVSGFIVAALRRECESRSEPENAPVKAMSRKSRVLS